jgi:hypothetical protein
MHRKPKTHSNALNIDERMMMMMLSSRSEPIRTYDYMLHIVFSACFAYKTHTITSRENPYRIMDVKIKTVDGRGKF